MKLAFFLVFSGLIAAVGSSRFDYEMKDQQVRIGLRVVSSERLTVRAVVQASETLLADEPHRKLNVLTLYDKSGVVAQADGVL